MYRLIRFFNQNRRTIIKIILIIVFIFILIQLFNLISKNKMNDNKNENVDTDEKSNVINENSALISDESLISGRKVSENVLSQSSDIIGKFINYCNDGNVELAYDMITDECKEEMFPSIGDFEKIYYSDIFDGSKKNYTVENWYGNVYRVRITDDILSTGNLNNNAHQDYITVVSDKININSYIGRKEINNVTNNNNVDIGVISKDTYMDYEIYTISVTNNSDNTILLDGGNNPKSIYLLDEKDMKYYFYNNEVVASNFIVPSQYKKTFKIKFSNSYSSSRTIRSMVFSNFIVNYDEYKNDNDDKSKYMSEFHAYM